MHLPASALRQGPFSVGRTSLRLLRRYSAEMRCGRLLKDENSVEKVFSTFLQIFLFYPLTLPLSCDILIFVDGALAQLVAHNTGSVGVSGSNPLCST